MMNLYNSRNVRKFLSFGLICSLIISCTEKEIDDVLIDTREKPDEIVGIVDYKTIDCHITEWFDNYLKAVVFTWDDANITHLLIDEVFKKHNYTATYFVQTNVFKQSSYFNEYKKLHERGNEIASHTVNHYYLPELSIAEVEKEVRDSANDIYNYYGYFPTTFAHPGSQLNTEIDSLIGEYYLNSRYSSILYIKDRLFWGFRSNESLSSIISVLDGFVKNNDKKWMIYAGHGVDGIGYEPINIKDLDVLLAHLQEFYSLKLWVTTFENSTMYKFLRENVKLEYAADFVFINRNSIIEQIQRYSNAQCVLTLSFPNLFILQSDGIVSIKIENNRQIVSIDLKKSRIIKFKKING